MLASAGINCRPVSVRPSVTSRCSTDTAKRMIDHLELIQSTEIFFDKDERPPYLFAARLS